MCALPAFWTGILYDNDIINIVWDHVKKWKFEEIEDLYSQVRSNGLNSKTPQGEDLINFTKKFLIILIKVFRKEKFLKTTRTSQFFKNLCLILLILENRLQSFGLIDLLMIGLVTLICYIKQITFENEEFAIN